MARACFRRAHEADFGDTLLRDLDWRDLRRNEGKLDALPATIVALVGENLAMTRHDLWLRLIQKQFMRYVEPEYNAAVKQLIATKRLIATGQLRTQEGR